MNALFFCFAFFSSSSSSFFFFYFFPVSKFAYDVLLTLAREVALAQLAADRAP